MYNVMVVDDIEIFRTSIKRKNIWGEKSGFKVGEEASNGEEALKKAIAGNVDIILTDIKMPKVTGIELLKKLRENNLDIPVIIMSDYSDFKYAKEALVHSALDYLVKPVKAEELIRVLQRAEGYLESKDVNNVEIENINTGYQTLDIMEIVQYISEGKYEVIEIVNRIIEAIFNELKGEPQKFENAVRGIAEKIYHSVIKKFPWYTDFFDVKWIKEYKFSEKSYEALVDFMDNALQQVIKNIDSLFYTTINDKRIEEVCRIIIENVENGISLDMISAKLNLNKSYISSYFKNKTGKNIVNHMTFVKIERAKVLIENREYKIYEIGYKLDYCDVEYFSRTFKKLTGVSPNVYKQKK